MLQLTLNLLFGGANTPNNAIYRKRYAVGPGFERPSRIVVALRLRKSSACVTPCLVGHRSKKQYSIVFCSLTGSGAPRIKRFFYFCA